MDYNKLSAFLINEIVPRAKKAKVSLIVFCPPEVVRFLFDLITKDMVSRKVVREILDNRVKELL